MRRIAARLLLAGLALALVGAVPARAQPPVPPGQHATITPASQHPERLEWRRREDKPFLTFLYVDARLSGCLDVERGVVWWPYDQDAKRYGKPLALFLSAK